MLKFFVSRQSKKYINECSFTLIKSMLNFNGNVGKKVNYKLIIPFSAQCAQKCTNCQNFDPKIRREHQKISYIYERRDYESVNENSIS